MKKVSSHQFIQFWWIFGVVIFVDQISFTKTIPVSVTKEKSSISLGPCTWVIDRSCPDIDIKFYLFTRNNPQDRQYIHIDETWDKSNLSSSNFNPHYPVKIIIHGYNADMFLRPLIQMKDDYLQRGDYNLFYVDWSILAPGPCYVSAVHNARHVGTCIAQLIERILEGGTANIHLIGFSLGAQVTNFVARNLGSFELPRITGLDPAMPLFITASTDDKLDPSDAMFVDVIHTNALVQGKIERCGHVDFYMNGGIIQPGCMTGGENPFACSHHRAPDYFAESIRSFRGFWGWACSSYISYLLGLCPQTNYLVLAGEDCNPESQGMFLITTNAEPPYALGKWTDPVLYAVENGPIIASPFTRHDPLVKEIDQWGKLDSSFNNIQNFPTPYSQDPNGRNWPYFGENGINEIREETAKLRNITSTNKTNNSKLNTVQNTLSSVTTKRKENLLTHSSSVQHEVENRQQFLGNYQKNLSLGIIDKNVFQIPKIQAF